MNKALFATCCSRMLSISLGRVRGAALCLEVLHNQVHHFCFIFVCYPSGIPFHCRIACSSVKLEPNPHACQDLICVFAIGDVLPFLEPYSWPWVSGVSHHSIIIHEMFAQAEHLSSFYDNYSWAKMIIEKDQQIFGPGGGIYASVQNIPHLPTPEEVDNAVELRVREFLSTSNPNGLNDEGSTLAPCFQLFFITSFLVFSIK
ncbi:putative signal peptide protein [Puccinia sorghi]|uniref:Putative signal peptide protein n=1 Tax=Puccinia sorghi TaxID=27349 RepID=A0A0L6URL9_9BASI|nr:putative signal peptide protein [Puccinia sorghi]